MRIWLSILAVLWCCSAGAATYTAASASEDDVLAKVLLATHRDTVVVPNGSAVWTYTLNITNGITLRTANGMGNTLITNNCATNYLIIISEPANETNFVYGFEFRPGTSPYQTIYATGANTDSRRLRIATNRWAWVGTGGAIKLDTVLGVFDHNEVFGNAPGNQLAHVKDSTWNGFTKGNGVWSNTTPRLGTEDAFFFEDNILSSTNTVFLMSLIDAQAGGRYVFRFNTVTNGYIEGHGSEAAYERSTHGIEIYGNSFYMRGVNQIVTFFRGGSGIIASNRIFDTTASTVFKLENNRMNDSLFSPFGGSDGRNHWDVNHASNPFDTGTCTSAGANTMTASGEAWTTSQWIGYTIRKTSGKTVSSLTRSGVTLTVNCTSHGFSNTVSSVYTIPTAGTGYTVNDTLTLVGGSGLAVGTLTVTAVSSGGVTAATVASAGSYSTLPGIEFNGDVSVTGGTGSGCKVRLIYTHKYVSIFGADQQEYNSLYITDSLTANSFRCYTSGALPTTPATGTILACEGNYFAEITANTATQITFNSSIYGGTITMSFAAADTFEINKVTHGMDQVGRIGGSLIDDTATPSFPPGWNNQTTSAWYQWSNHLGNITSPTFAPTSGTIVEGTHFFNNTVKSGWGPYTYPHPLAGGVADDSIPAIDATDATGTNGYPFTYSVIASHGVIFGYAATNLPAGLTISASTGIISGTPTAPGVVTLGLFATNASGFGWTNIMVEISVSARSPYLMTTGISPNDSTYSQDLVRTLPYTYTLCAIDYLIWTNTGGVTYYDALYALNSSSSMLWTFYNVPTNAIASFLPEILARYPLIWAVQPINEEADYSILQSTIYLYSLAVTNKPLVGPAWVNNQSDAYAANMITRGVFTNLDSFVMHDYLQVPGNGGLSNPPWPEGSYYHPYESPPGGFTNFYGRLMWMTSFTNYLRTNYPSIPKVMVPEFGLFVSNVVDAVIEATNVVYANVVVGFGAPEGPAGLFSSVPYSYGCYSQSNTIVVWSPSMLAFLGALTNPPPNNLTGGAAVIGTLNTY